MKKAEGKIKKDKVKEGRKRKKGNKKRIKWLEQNNK